MHALSYERRRLTGVRSTWVITAAVLALDAAVAALTARQPSLDEPVRVLTAAVPLLPLPLAALGAGGIGALSYGQEVRYPALLVRLRPLRRRAVLLAAKAAVTGGYALALALLGMAVALVPMHLAGHDRAWEAQALHGNLPPALIGYPAVVVAGAWTGLLAAALARSAAAGLLAVVVLPLVAEPLVRVLLGPHVPPSGGPGRLWWYGPLSGLESRAALSPLELCALVGGPVLLLALLCLVVLPRRVSL